LVVDAVEGVMLGTEMAINSALSANTPLTLVINKVDRLIVELKLTPDDAYFKLRHTIDSVNKYIQEQVGGVTANANQAGERSSPILSPEAGNVAFASSQHGYCFTLETFAQRFMRESGLPAKKIPLSEKELAKRLWGDAFYNSDSGTFHKKRSDVPKNTKRTFVSFVLEPLYKIYGVCLGISDEKAAGKVLRSVGINLQKATLRMSARPMLRAAMMSFFDGDVGNGFVDLCVDNFPDPKIGGWKKLRNCYTGEQNITSCDEEGPLLVNVVKLFSSPDGTGFSALGRIYSGTIKAGDKVKVLGEEYSAEDEEVSERITASEL